MVLVSEYSDMDAAEDAKSLGNLAFQRKDYKQAISQYTKAIDINQDTSLHVYYSNRSACHLALKEWEAGLEDASKCVAINGNFVKGHFRRIVALSELGRLEEAKAIIEMVQQMDGLSSGEMVDLARLEETLSTAEAQEESIQCSECPLSSSWDAGDLGFELKRLGNQAFKVGHFDEAVSHYSEAINRLDCEGLDDEVAVVHNNRAACWQQLGDHQRVIEDCDATLRVLNGNIKALIRRGLAHEALEMYQAAHDDMTAALRQESRSTIASQARGRLQKLLKARQDEFVIVAPDSPSAEMGPNWSTLDIDEISI